MSMGTQDYVKSEVTNEKLGRSPRTNQFQIRRILQLEDTREMTQYSYDDYVR